MMSAIGTGEVEQRLVFHFQAIETDNAKIFTVCLPDLALLQFESHGRNRGRSGWVARLVDLVLSILERL